MVLIQSILDKYLYMPITEKMLYRMRQEIVQVIYTLIHHGLLPDEYLNISPHNLVYFYVDGSDIMVSFYDQRLHNLLAGREDPPSK